MIASTQRLPNKMTKHVIREVERSMFSAWIGRHAEFKLLITLYSIISHNTSLDSDPHTEAQWTSRVLNAQCCKTSQLPEARSFKSPACVVILLSVGKRYR